MSFATGSGDYVQLMNAILSFAVADGWIEDGGVGTGWPISKGRVRGVDWDTATFIENDLTIGGVGGQITSRSIYLGLGATPAIASSNAATQNGSRFRNAHYVFSNWWLFSDPASGADYVHAVVKFSNGVNSDVYGHISFGEIQRYGMTHGGVMYSMAHRAFGFAATNGSGNGAGSWNSYNRGHNIWTGAIGEAADAFSDLNIIANSPLAADSAAGFPSVDVWYNDGDKVWDATGLGADLDNVLQWEGQNGSGMRWTTNTGASNAMPFSGAVSFMNCPCILMNGNFGGARAVYAGDFPNVRICGLGETFLGEEEIIYAGETWQIFPWLRNTANNVLNDQGVVTSGRLGVAYKKVV